MRVEVLFVAGCPTHQVAMRLLSDVLAAEGIPAEIREVLVADEGMAKELGFPGSPTIRINGRDIIHELQKPEAFGLCCRLYTSSKQAGVPPIDMIRRAVRNASQKNKQ